MINCNLLKEHLLFSLTGSLYCIDWNGCESVFVCKPVFGILIFIKSSDQTCSLRPRKTDSLRKVNLLSRNVTRYTAWEYFWINLCKKKKYNCCIVGGNGHTLRSSQGNYLMISASWKIWRKYFDFDSNFFDLKPLLILIKLLLIFTSLVFWYYFLQFCTLESIKSWPYSNKASFICAEDSEQAGVKCSATIKMKIYHVYRKLE